MSDKEILDHFLRLGYVVTMDELVFSSEQVSDFREACRAWLRVGRTVRDEEGLLILEDSQPIAGQPTRDIVVVSLGHARATMGVISKGNRRPYHRYAPKMS
jgi:hypothetical protein